jgi:two-component system, NarL family, sensor histidine kinase UhpB
MKTKTKILIVEHDPYDIELLQYELKTGGINHETMIVQTEKDYADALIHFIPDIILSDFSLPSFDGDTAFKIKEQLSPGTPFIFVSGYIGEERSIEYIRNGVTDYVLKDKLFALTTKVVRALKEAEEKQQKNKIEQERMHSERRLARAQQVAHMGSWELDFATNDFRLSDEACRIYGLRPGQNRQSFDSLFTFIHPEDVKFVFQKVKESRESLRNFSFHYRILHKTGFVRHIYSECKLEFDANGRPVGLHGIAHDITKKILLENQLVQERLERQREITDAVLTAQENEREDIGKELHDNLNQILAVAKMYLQMAKAQENNREMYIDKSCGFIVKVIEEIRRITKKLVIPEIHIIGLFDNIKNLLDDLIMIHPIKISFREDGVNEAELNKKLQRTIFRIVQEQLNNILKHAKATHAFINLSRQENQLILLISDNGEGCNVLQEKSGVGIINIKSRAELYNGKVTIVSKPGEGYELKVILPLVAA